MTHKHQMTYGIQRLVEKYKHEFRKTENLSHYSDQDYNKAEKQYVAYRLKHGWAERPAAHP